MESRLLPRAQTRSTEEYASIETKCTNKVILSENVVLEQTKQCSHIFEEECYPMYETVMELKKVEECVEKFKTVCYVGHREVAKKKIVELCLRRKERDCNEVGETVCSPEHEMGNIFLYKLSYILAIGGSFLYAYYFFSFLKIVCETISPVVDGDDDEDIQKFMPIHQNPTTFPESFFPSSAVSRSHRSIPMTDGEEPPKSAVADNHLPETRCRQVERTVCGPQTCPVVEREKECRTEPKWVTVSIPEEECTIQPETVCEVKMKPIPKLVTEERCDEFPKEICHTLLVPKTIKRPVVKEWCYKRRKFNYSGHLLLRPQLN